MNTRDLLTARRSELVSRLAEVEARIAEIDYLLGAIEPTLDRDPPAGYLSPGVTRARNPRTVKKEQSS